MDRRQLHWQLYSSDTRDIKKQSGKRAWQQVEKQQTD